MLCFLFTGFSACTESEAQQDFEDRALRPPAGITAMSVNGTPVENGENDSDDWQTAPDFQGSISVFTAAFPNPVPFNSQFEIQLDVRLDAVTGLRIFAFQQPTQPMNSPVFQQAGTISPGILTVRLRPQQFASSAGTGSNLYRIIFFDGRGNIISYGDVEIE